MNKLSLKVSLRPEVLFLISVLFGLACGYGISCLSTVETLKASVGSICIGLAAFVFMLSIFIQILTLRLLSRSKQSGP